jgi:hypothetical protein
MDVLSRTTVFATSNDLYRIRMYNVYRPSACSQYISLYAKMVWTHHPSDAAVAAPSS